MKKFISVIAFFLLSQYLFSQNHTPMAVNDYVTTFRGHAIVNVLVNDYDVDGDTIKIFTYSIPYHGTILKILGNFLNIMRHLLLWEVGTQLNIQFGMEEHQI